MAEQQFTDDYLASLYDVFESSSPRADLQFYLPMIMSAQSVLDVGCGTGTLLQLAREHGHTGRLCGLDPADGMLNQARRQADIEWVLGDMSTVAWDRAFDLIVMTGHAFQEFLTDDEIRGALAAIHLALTHNGQFAFETRNPLARGWEQWDTRYTREAMDTAGIPVRRECRVEHPIIGDIVRFNTRFSSPAWKRPQASHGELRFVSEQSLAALLAESGLAIVEQFGDWNGDPLTPSGPEMITIVGRG